MLNLPQGFRLGKEWLFDPRFRIEWTYETEKNLSLSLRAGYGVQHKLPTLDFLYPDYIYRYFSSLNVYYSNPEKDHLMTYVIKNDPANPELKAMCNKKKEIGLDISFKRYRFSLTLFQEDVDDGYAYSSYYSPIAYPVYKRPLGGVLPDVGRPVKEDFHEDIQKDFSPLYMVANSEKIIKKGIEYRFRTPLYKVIRTQFEVNGAYYHTLYASSIPIMYRPSIIEFGEKYPYVGIYGQGNHRHYHRFNTNIWANTHIPEWGVILTHFFQFIWYSKSYYGREQSPFPYEIMDLDGIRHPIGEAEIAQMKDLKSPLRYLNLSLDDLYYRPNITPVSIRLSFKGTKQLGDHVRLSFFVDNIIDFSPKYIQKDQTTAREWVIPYFGLETSIRF